MKEKISSIIRITNYILITCSMFITTLTNISNEIIILFLYFILISSYTIRTFAYNKKKHLLVITYSIDIICIIFIQKYDNYLIFLVPIFILIEDFVLNVNKKLSLLLTLLIYILTCGIFYFKYINNSSIMVLYMLILVVILAIEYLIFYLIKYLLKQNQIINEIVEEITIQNIEKDNLNKNLREAYSKVENITALRERNKIAVEIHNTVGHTLTTVLVELEASKRLMHKDLDKAIEKLNLAQGQVRKGLESIRGSVRVLERGKDILDFFNSIDALIEDTENHSDVIIKTNIDRNINISEKIQKIIFNCLMEGLTNGIKHGGSTAFYFELTNNNGFIKFSLQDNGKGTSVISYGFGLRTMKNIVEELNGTFNVQSKEGEGFNLDICFCNL